MSNSKTVSVSSLATAYHKAALLIQTMALGPVFSNQLVKLTGATHCEVCCILSQLVEMNVVKMSKGATPKYTLADTKDAIQNADVIAAGLKV